MCSLCCNFGCMAVKCGISSGALGGIIIGAALVGPLTGISTRTVYIYCQKASKESIGSLDCTFVHPRLNCTWRNMKPIRGRTYIFIYVRSRI